MNFLKLPLSAGLMSLATMLTIGCDLQDRRNVDNMQDRNVDNVAPSSIEQSTGNTDNIPAVTNQTSPATNPASSTVNPSTANPSSAAPQTGTTPATDAAPGGGAGNDSQQIAPAVEEVPPQR